MSKPAAPQGTLSPGITPHDLLHSGRPGLSKTMGGPSLRPGQLDKLGCHQRVPGGHLALRGGFEHAGRQPWQLHNQTAGSSGGEESCWAATTDPSPLRNSQPPVPKCARSSPSSLPLPHMAEKRLSKMLRSHSALNKNALRHYRGCVGFFLTGGGQCQGHVLLETVGGGRGWWQVLGLLVSCSFCLLLSPHVHPPKEAHRDVPPSPEGSRKGWRVQTIEICSGTL